MNTLRSLPQLRPYQREVARAVVESVRRRRGLTFSVEIARQGGKNEVSARIELLLLARSRRLYPEIQPFEPWIRKNAAKLVEAMDRAG